MTVKPQSQSPCRQAFTLVEMLTAMGIALLLVGLLLPVLGRAREASRRTKCLSNLRNVGVGVTMYASESGGQMPPYLYSAQRVEAGINSGWILSIKSNWSMEDVGLVGKPDVLLCPSDKTPSIINTTDSSGKPVSVPVSYGYNFEPFIQGSRLAKIASAKIVMLFDGNPLAVTTTLWYGTPQYGNCPTCDTNKRLLCHIVPGSGNRNTICVGEPALSSHLGHGDPCGPCTNDDASQFNNLALNRRHSNKAMVIFLDGHGELLASLPADGL